jgi:hypothetical protein
MIARRANDGSAIVMAYTPKAGIGFWQPTPPAFQAGTFLHWGKMAPFGLARADQFRPKAPPPLTSNEYKRHYDEVKSVGSTFSTDRPQDRADIARFTAMTSPTNLWNSSIERRLRSQRWNPYHGRGSVERPDSGSSANERSHSPRS